jgi:transcription-repair coupling factor (superfamily II helicase)
MALRSLLAHIEDDPAALALSREGGNAFVSSSLRPYLIAALAEIDPAARARAQLVLVGDDRAARDLAADLRAWLEPRRVRYYPSRGVTYESHLAPPPHLVGLRMAALDALLGANGDADADEHGRPVVVVSAVALSEKVPDPALRPHSFTLRVGELLDLEECAAELVGAGYERTDQVEERGQFALRGGLLDVFGATEERPVRVDMFDVEIESLRWFSTFTQRSLSEAEEVEIAPAAELGAEYRELAELAASEDRDERPDVAEILPVDRFRSFLDLVPKEAAVVVAAAEELRPGLTDHWHDVTTSLHSTDAHHLYVPPAEVELSLDKRVAVTFSTVPQDQPHEFRAQAADGAARSIREAEPELEKLVRNGYATVVAWSHRGEADRAAYNMARLRPTFVDGGRRGTPDGEGALWFAVARLREGFVAPQLKLAVIPEHRLLRRRRPERADTRPGRVLAAFTDLRKDDIVVHVDHGIGRFTGFDTKTVANVTRDYLELEYRDGDRVFVPTDQLDKLSRYVGADGHAPPLSKLGSKTWDNMKARARRAAEELAGELLTIYAERKRRSGHGFAEDSDWQLEFERAFPYRETDDQLEAIEQTKADMEAERPMDRLICGDVGYGKTEVALRAAFKAASEGRQTMVLAPTTILAQQHFGTFGERLRDFPFRIELLSRFRSPKEQRAVIRDFAQGKVDILIGTHRLLSRDIEPRELGLVIVDEEQRFGVKQKERLRQLRLSVDVLALSATPIPRTLQMSLAGLRDISVIETPPEGRRPIHTYVGEYDDELVRGAIERELDRGGQVFYLHDRVETIDEAAERIRALVPKARVAVAHGQMEAAALEQAMLDFLRGSDQVLVSTTIIESGLDIPSANTLIIERADRLGLAQLYQIRGRVGRSRERAHAYLMYPSADALTHEAAARLSTLSDYTELGSGFKIAMRDLEIRGAGNLLGSEQSGHVAAVGFELYCRMLDEAVQAAHPEAAGEPWEPVRLDVPVDAYVPAEYIPYEVAKIDVHRRIAAAREPADLEALVEELEDRFGPVPEPVEALLKLQDARVKLGRAGARTAELRGDRLVIAPVELDSSQSKTLREELDEVVYESLKRTLRVGMPDDEGERLQSVLRTAEALERVKTQLAAAA